MRPSSVLSDGTIRRLVEEGRVRIDPWDPAALQPASVDLRLGGSFRVFHNHRAAAIDLDDPPTNLTEQVRVEADEAFVIHPGEFVLGRTLEWVELPDDVVARIEGKALALDTEVPTPAGWRTMGDLEAGDEVFDPDGAPTRVTAVTQPLVGRPCRAVVLSDGTRVVADAAHGWEVRARHDRARDGLPRVMTTAELERALARGDGPEHDVDLAAPVRYPESALPLDPYALGASGASPTQGTLLAVGSPARDDAASGPPAVSLRDRETRRDGLIPRGYLEASVAQRQALLEGLMDAHGEVDERGRCVLATTDRILAAQARELVAGLGFAPVLATRTVTLRGRVGGLRHEVAFTADRPVFRLPRKLACQPRSGRLARRRAIMVVEPVPSVPVCCVQVASPRGAFLVTRSFVPTHNSSLGRLGLIVHATAGFVDPGWRGTLTLEITNLTRVPIKLYAGRRIAQLSFMGLDAPAERPYGHPELGSHYQGQEEATESRYGASP
jgi:deoxycytidine triphosphate deaminase